MKNLINPQPTNNTRHLGSNIQGLWIHATAKPETLPTVLEKQELCGSSLTFSHGFYARGAAAVYHGIAREWYRTDVCSSHDKEGLLQASFPDASPYDEAFIGKGSKLVVVIGTKGMSAPAGVPFVEVEGLAPWQVQAALEEFLQGQNTPTEEGIFNPSSWTPVQEEIDPLDPSNWTCELPVLESCWG